MTELELEDGELQSAMHPDTFDVPTLTERLELTVGSVVKLGFLASELNERMWLTVTAVDGDGYTGRLDSHPFSPDRTHGELIRFEPRHVLDIYEPAHQN